MGHYRRELRQARCRRCCAVLSAGFVLPAAIKALCTECAEPGGPLSGVRQGKHPVVLVWAIDRLSRRGSEDMQRYLRMLAESGADVRSREEPWLNTADPFAREILIGVYATLAKYQSEQRSRNISAGLARKKAAGEQVGGRKPGAKDKRPRKRRGSPVRQTSG